MALRIINSNVWEKALRNSTEDPDTGKIDTPMRKMIKKMPGGWSGRTQVGGQGEHRWVVKENTGGRSGRTQVGGQGEHR